MYFFSPLYPPPTFFLERLYRQNNFHVKPARNDKDRTI